MIKQSSFIPAWWLRNPHLQTMWGTMVRNQIQVNTRKERLELPDNDFLDLNWLEPFDNDPKRPIILILHGLGGSIDSHYARAILHSFQEQGWHAVFMHYRGCSGEPNRTFVSYHCGFTDDIAYVINVIKKRYPKNPLAAVGYSLGGSILLNWLGKTGLQNDLVSAIAISVPFELNKAANRMLNGFSRFYQWHLLKSLRSLLIDKFEHLKGPITMQQIDSIQNFWELDNFVTAPLYGFKNVNDYYEKASCRKNLKHIKKPTLIIHAEDDPFMTADVIPSEEELSAETNLELSQMGGHVGFISGTIPGSAEYWLENRIINHFLEFFPQLEKVACAPERSIGNGILSPVKKGF